VKEGLQSKLGNCTSKRGSKRVYRKQTQCSAERRHIPAGAVHGSRRYSVKRRCRRQVYSKSAAEAGVTGRQQRIWYIQASAGKRKYVYIVHTVRWKTGI